MDLKTLRTIAALRSLRAQSLWRLLAADKAPAILALLQTLLLDNEKVLSSSVLKERLTREIEQLRASGEELPQSAQAYIADWLTQGWLTRRFPAGASEEEYELTTDAANAIRSITALLKPRLAATESRLATVIQQLVRLAEETDSDPKTRSATLIAERERIERELALVQRGAVKALPDDRALERTREIVALADDLAGDFRRVRDEFDKLNRHLRESVMENEGSRGDVLEALFAGVDVIGASDAGKTFAAFWRLLTDPEQSSSLEAALSEVIGRPFARGLDAWERRFLLRLTRLLMDEGSSVHDVLQNFARSLKSFVQSREYLEQRRLHALLKDALRAALEMKDYIRLNRALDYSFTLTSSRIRSVSQWVMYDPSQRLPDPEMKDAELSEIGLDWISELVRQSEIDFRTLRLHIRQYLAKKTQASIGQLLESFPAEQGLGSVVGYVALGVKHGEITGEGQIVWWEGDDGVVRRARIPAIYFLRERCAELAD
jgi:Protein of unknown function (DUF3375)